MGGGGAGGGDEEGGGDDGGLYAMASGGFGSTRKAGEGRSPG